MREIKSGRKLNGKILTRQSIAGDTNATIRYVRKLGMHNIVSFYQRS